MPTIYENINVKNQIILNYYCIHNIPNDDVAIDLYKKVLLPIFGFMLIPCKK